MSKKRKTASKATGRSSLSAKNEQERAGKTPPAGLTRRGFMQGVGVAGGVAVVAKSAHAATKQPKVLPAKKVPITLNVNGKDYRLRVEPRITLLRALRNDLDLTGTKEICDRGSCGGCSITLDGQLVNSCMLLAVDAVGRKVGTIEGLAKGDKMHPLQEAFCKHDALQCGFCTPGMLMACKTLLDSNKNPSLVQIKKGLSGNICRCGTYNNIFAAVQTAAKSG
jgi:aerobic-type carbon monoxide dehydrogenase small subunit (CoxS/CutS family)